MNAAEKARLAREAQKTEKEERREKAREGRGKRLIMIAVIVGVLVVLGAGTFGVIKIVQNYRANRTELDGVRYAFKDGKYTAEALTGTDADVIIHGTVNDLPVTAVKRNFGQKSTTMKTLTVEADYDMEIAKKAFDSCTALKKVVFTGDGTVSIKADAFKNCPMLTDMTVIDAHVLGEQYLFDGRRAPALTIKIENGSFRQLYDTVKRVEVGEGSSFGATIIGSGVIANEFVLLGNVRSVGSLGFGFQRKPHLIAPVYYISEEVTEIPDNLFGTEKEADKLDIYFGGTEAQWNALIATADRSTNQYFFDLGDNVTVRYEQSYDDFNNR